MTHEAARELLLELAYGELPDREAAAVRAHVDVCEACGEEWARIARTRGAMRGLSPELPPERGERVLLAAARDAAERMGAGRRRSRSPLWRLAATAALVVAVGGVSWRLLARREAPPEAAPDLRARAAAPAGRPPAAAPALAEASRPEGKEAVARKANPSREGRPLSPALAGPGPGEGAGSAVAAAAPARAAAEDRARPAKAGAPPALPPAASLEAEVGRLVERGGLRLVAERTRGCGDGVVRIEVWAEAAGRPRRVVATVTGGATPRTVELLYDADGALRLARVRAAGASRLVAFDQAGRRVLEEGGGAGAAPWPDRELPRRAATSAEDFGCP